MLKKIFGSLLCLAFFVQVSAQIIYHNEWIDYSKTYYKIKVMGFGLDTAGAPLRTGMVRIPYSALAANSLGSVPAEQFQLWRDGQEVPLFTSVATGSMSSNDYIEFVGTINNGVLDNELYRNTDFQLSNKWSLQTDTAAYFLTVNVTGNNKRYQPISNSIANNTLAPSPYFMYTMGRYFRNITNGFYATVGENLYSSSYDRGEGFMSRAVRPVGGGCGSATLPQFFFRLYPYLQGPQMTLNVNAVGDQQNSRTFRLTLNGDSVSTYQMDYINYVRTEDYVDVSKISTNNAAITVVNQSPSLCDEMRVSSIELTYPRQFNMDGRAFFDFKLEPSDTGYYLTIVNFNHGGVAPVIYDIDNNKRYTTDISSPDTVKVVLDPSTIPYNLALTTQTGNYFRSITNLQTRNFTDFGNPVNQGNYLIISNPLIYGTGSQNYVEQYRQYRSSSQGGGYNAKVIDINDLIDQFAWGVKKHPLSVKNFLKYARRNFADTLRYAFLIGKGVMYADYRANESNPLAEQLNLIPTWGNPASDNLLASDNLTAVPATAIGRLSAVSPKEVGDYLQKVKQHDSIQQSPIRTMATKGHLKNVLQIAGANDISLGNQIDGYLQNYKTMISDTMFGANVTDFSKTADPGGYPDAINSFKRIYESGAALITYFGHSSNTSLDFNLDNPENYNNQYRYPVFIANGCSAGNHFLFDANRPTVTTTISEKFVLSPERGAVGYIASSHFGVINYLDLYTKNFYKSMGITRYNQSIGRVVQEAIRASLASTGNGDYFNRVHAEQYSLHGDPAVLLNYAPLPDYVIEAPQLTASPSFVSVADTSFTLKVRINNIGKATKDSVGLRITRTAPNGQVFKVFERKVSPIYFADSIIIDVPIIGNRDKGVNTISAWADYSLSIAEMADSNNMASITVLISDEEIKPVYPYNYAIINNPVSKLYASTVNPLGSSRQYVMELDTTALYNSPAKVSKQVTSVGGVLEFDPGISYDAGTTYYWRVAPAGGAQPNWIDFSFTYKPTGGPGFQQGHVYQHLQSTLTRLTLDSASARFSYKNKLRNLFLINSIYPTSGTEDEHFSVSVDGSSIITSACLGSSVIFNVFDSLTFQPWLNTTNPFGAPASCGNGRQYNFEYQYRTAASRKNAMDFFDAIPNGTFVSVRLILDQPYNSYAPAWAADTSLYGSGNSLYHRLKNAGFTGIDSFITPRTWVFVFRKGDPTFTPQFAMSNGLFDRITLNVNCNTKNVQGDIISPLFGPAKQWTNVNWSGYRDEVGADNPKVKVIGVKPGRPDSLLYTLDTLQQTFSLASVDVNQFPQIRLQMNNTDSVRATPYQLTNWNISYEPVPEGAIAPNLYLDIRDSVSTIAQPAPGQQPGTLHVGVAFKNVSVHDFDTLSMRIIMYDSSGGYITYPLIRLRSLNAGDTLHIDEYIDVSTLPEGWYNMLVYINPDGLQPEQYTFNNFMYKYVYVTSSITLPLQLVSFRAALTEGNKVNTTWQVAQESGVKTYEVLHSTNGTSFSRIGTVNAVGKNNYNLIDNAPSIGKNYYRLNIINANGTVVTSPIRMVVLQGTNEVKVFPNPARDVVRITMSEYNGKGGFIKVMNATGQTMYLQPANSNASINTSGWPAGTYLVQINDGNNLHTHKIQKQ